MHVIHEPTQWNQTVASLHGGVLQSWEWGQLKQQFGWKAHRLLWKDDQGQPVACAQLLFRQPDIPLIGHAASVAYCPRGPVLDWQNATLREQVLRDLVQQARQANAIFIKIDPEIVTARKDREDGELIPDPAGTQIADAIKASGFQRSPSQIQFANTMELELDQDPEALLAAMKQKTRYNIRLAGKKGVTVRLGSRTDLDLLYQMYAETSLRDGFVIRKPEYYQLAWGSFIDAGLAQPFIAMVEDQPVAALILFHLGDKAIYMYGMSTQAHRKLMPNHLLQWEAIQWAQQKGYRLYDFWGAPDNLTPEDSMWGVYRFKLGFGARFTVTPGAWDLVLRPVLHVLYEQLMPAVLNLMRSRGRAQTRLILEP